MLVKLTHILSNLFQSDFHLLPADGRLQCTPIRSWMQSLVQRAIMSAKESNDYDHAANGNTGHDVVDGNAGNENILEDDEEDQSVDFDDVENIIFDGEVGGK